MLGRAEEPAGIAIAAAPSPKLLLGTWLFGERPRSRGTDADHIPWRPESPPVAGAVGEHLPFGAACDLARPAHDRAAGGLCRTGRARSRPPERMGFQRSLDRDGPGVCRGRRGAGPP